MNVFVSPDKSAVMCTAWQSKIEDRGREREFQHPAGGDRPLLQTWNPQVTSSLSLSLSIYLSLCVSLFGAGSLQAMEQAAASTTEEGGSSPKGKSHQRKGTAAQKGNGTLAEELVISRAWFDRQVTLCLSVCFSA